jgi:PIN domain nuclease of toxin-antitoxin system
MRQVLRRWQHLLNTPSAPITDELDLQKGLNRLQTGQIRAKRLEYDPFKEFAILIVALATLIDARHPFDRMLLAQAFLEPLRLVTADKALLVYGGAVELV